MTTNTADKNTAPRVVRTDEGEAKYNTDGTLASLSIPMPPGYGGVEPPRRDAWDEVNTLRRALKENSRGYLASTAAVVISCCFLVSIAAGSLLAMPVVAVVATYDSLQRFFKGRKATKESKADSCVVPSGEGE